MGKKLLMLLVCLLTATSMAFAQFEQVTGTVIDSDTGEPLAGASVKVIGTTIGTLTDINGKFTLKNLPKSAEHIEVSFMGMNTVRTIIKRNMAITLTANASDMDEVMVQAFGKAKKSAFTGSATVISSEDLQKSQVSSVTEALNGAVAGLSMSSDNGAPGSTSTMRLRGMTSMNAGNNPLIIVDGAPYGDADLNSINPNDVESITVLKDAASNALYGARGANGVIMITTKRAQQGHEARVTFDAKWGGNSRALQYYDVIGNPAQYYEMQYAALNNKFLSDGYSANQAWQLANSALLGPVDGGGLGYNIYNVPEGQMLIGSNGRLNPNATMGHVVNYKGEQYYLTPDDWEKEGTRTGLRQEYNASVAASGEKTNFYMSLGYLGNEGIIENSGQKRLTARIRADYQAKKWLKVGASAAYARYSLNELDNNGNQTSTANVWAFTSQMAPIYPFYVRYGDGSIRKDNNGITVLDYGQGMNGGGQRPFIYNANPIQDLRLNTYVKRGNSLNANAFADITFMPGLVLTVNATTNLDEYRYNLVYNPYYGQFNTTGGTVQVEHDRYYNYDLQQLLNYTTTIKDNHNLNIMVGHEYYRTESSTLSAMRSQMFSQENQELDGAVVDSKDSRSSRNFYNNEGWMARAMYDYKEKYFAQASFRYDGSSRFKPGHRWGSFWSVGAAWRISKEKWFKADWVNELKIKASYGKQGNDQISNYLYVDRYTVVNSSDKVGISFAGKGSEGISWEKNGNLNAGVEFSLFKNRISGGIDFYYRKTTDMLFSFSVAPSNGYSSYYDNVGDMYNLGVEFDLNFGLIRKKNFQWDFRLNGASLKNNISYLHPDKRNSTLYDADGKKYKGYVNGGNFMAEGLSMYTAREKEFAGVDPTTGESLWYKNVYQTYAEDVKDETGAIIHAKGDYVLDADKDQIVAGRETTNDWSKADYYMTGQSSLPKFYGGFGTTLKFYNFDVSINFTYSLGGKAYDATYANFMSSPTSSHGGWNFHRDLLDAWTPEAPSAEIPRFQYGDLYTAGGSTRFLTSTNYLNINNINVGYTIPKKFNFVESIRVYFAAENVAYFSARKGFDPRQANASDEVINNDVNATTYSPIRTISGGLTVTF